MFTEISEMSLCQRDIAAYVCDYIIETCIHFSRLASYELVFILLHN